MGDTKQSRDKQAHDEDDRARRRAVEEELARFHETEPPRGLDDALEALEYPAPAERVAEAAEEYEVQTETDAIPVAEIIAETNRETFESPADVREKVQRPSVAASLRRLRDVSREAGLEDEFRNREDVYRTTLRALEDVDADDDDEGVAAVTAWIVAEMQDEQRLPSSRKTRQRGAAFCRDRGYEIRDDSWLGA
jgi:hypothetical protein